MSTKPSSDDNLLYIVLDYLTALAIGVGLAFLLVAWWSS